MKKAAFFYLTVALSNSVVADIQYERPNCFIENRHIYLSQNYHINLADEPINALKSGIEFYFSFVNTLSNRGEIWPTQQLYMRERTLRYDHISRQFIVTDNIDGIQQSFNNAEAATIALGHIEKWPIAAFTAPPIPLLSGELHLNLDKLPVALRLSTLFDKAWALNSEKWICQPSA